MIKTLVRKNAYFDSVFLMLATKALKQQPGVKEAVVAMGTEVNLALLKEIGLLWEEAESARPNDLVIAVDAETRESAEEACRIAEEILKEKSHGGPEAEYRPVSLDGALKIFPDANLAVISVPGMYAAREARKALRAGLHVMVFSDHVPVEEEVELKDLALEKGLLMMGPDCGTAILNGKPLCFANVVRRGPIGLVAASGSGLQEVCCCIDRMGGGISQAIGTGGRDLQDPRVRGRMMLMGSEALKEDPQTRVIVVLSKPPAEEVAATVISKLEEARKPCVVHFLGRKPSGNRRSIWFSENMEEAAAMAVALSKGEAYLGGPGRPSGAEMARVSEAEVKAMSSEQRYMRGLFAGGTLATEAMAPFEREGFRVFSNVRKESGPALRSPHRSEEHTIVDMGDDVFTLGRPHPMIDPSLREERIMTEAADPETALLLLDVVLGYGAHEDPCGPLAQTLAKAKAAVADRGGYLSVIASITGTERDFQNMAEQKRKLDGVGCMVMPSNYQAAVMALHVIKKLRARWT
ncbi:MAG: acyl-CoA synthetase FdrA [Deltaproteobacteria bacterium]